MPLGSMQQFAINPNVILFRIGSRTEFSHDLPIDRHQPGSNHLFGFAPRGDPSSGHNFLEAFGSHV